MLYIKHRVNSVKELQETSDDLGVEIDVRAWRNDIIINHEPFEDGVPLQSWLSNFKHKFLIINVKEDGLEKKCLDLMELFNITNFFFLDQPFPSLNKLIKEKPNICAVRVSDFEPVETALKLKPGWAWLDSHEGDWSYLTKSIKLLKANGIKLCLVSPELQRVETDIELQNLNYILSQNKLVVDAVCTKNPSAWGSILKT